MTAPRKAMMVSDILNYTGADTTLRDIAMVVGTTNTLRNETEIAVVVERADTMAALRKSMLKHAEAIMTNIKAPHHNCGEQDQFLYIGSRIGEIGRFKAFKVSARPSHVGEHAMPMCVPSPNPLLVFWVFRKPINETQVRWVCKPYAGDPQLYGDLFTPHTEFLVSYKKPAV